MSFPPPSDPPGWQPPPSGPGWSSSGGPPPPGSGFPGGQPTGYPMPGYGGLREHPQGTTVLVLGILSLVVCQILGPVAWVMGSKALAEIDQAPMSYGNRGNVQAGRICGIISSVLLIVVLAFFFLAFIAALAGSSSTAP